MHYGDDLKLGMCIIIIHDIIDADSYVWTVDFIFNFAYLSSPITEHSQPGKSPIGTSPRCKQKPLSSYLNGFEFAIYSLPHSKTHRAKDNNSHVAV